MQSDGQTVELRKGGVKLSLLNNALLEDTDFHSMRDQVRRTTGAVSDACCAGAQMLVVCGRVCQRAAVRVESALASGQERVSQRAVVPLDTEFAMAALGRADETSVR